MPLFITKMWVFESYRFLYDVINVQLGNYVLRQRHNVRVYELLVRVELNNSDKETRIAQVKCLCDSNA